MRRGHGSDAWPDTAEGLTRLRRHFTISTLSNAGMAAVMAIVKRAHLPFDDILTAELVKSYKPAPAVYQFAVDYLGNRPDQILMVACHTIRERRRHSACARHSLRGLSSGPDVRPDIAPESSFDCCVDRFTALADALGV